MTKDEFTKLFEPFGQITSAILQLDEEGKSKGFGFVNYETHEMAQAALDALHGNEIKGKALSISRAQKRSERENELRYSFEETKIRNQTMWQGCNLYVKNISTMEDDTLRTKFEPYGTINSCKIMRHVNGTSRGFGFVCYSNPVEAIKAVAGLNNKIVEGKLLFVSLAEKRDQRRQRLESVMRIRQYERSQRATTFSMTNQTNLKSPFQEGASDSHFPHMVSQAIYLIMNAPLEQRKLAIKEIIYTRIKK